MTLPSNRDNIGLQQESFPELLVSFVVSPAGFIAMGVGCGFAAAMFEGNARYGNTSGAACGFAIAAGLCAVAAAIVRVGRRV